MSLESHVQAAPKAELHVHLEGAIQHQITSLRFSGLFQVHFSKLWYTR
jgi:adenosine deaminase